MTPAVYLHIGEPKSGTTYIQSILQANAERLGKLGVLIPNQRLQIRAAQSTIRDKGGRAQWLELASSVLDWRGKSSVISMETLCRADTEAIEPTVSAFGGADVHAVITSRDLVRSLPAQWQQSTQHRKSWSWAEYSSAVIDAEEVPPTRNFWSQHDLERILHDWVRALSPDRVSVVTLPQAGGDPDELWRRFAESVDLPKGELEMVRPANESLGAASSELLRRLNLTLDSTDLTDREYNQVVRAVVARKVLGPRRSKESRVVAPEAAAPWAARESERIISAVRSSGVRVIGDLEDLRPKMAGVAADQGQPSDAELAEAAVDAVAGLVDYLATRKRDNN